MGLFARIKAVCHALLNKSVTEMEDKHVIALAESKLQQATERLKEARQGLINYQALVLKVQHRVEGESSRITTLTGQIKNRLNLGQEEMASQLALKLARVKGDLASNEEQLKQHQENYEKNLLRMKTALKDIETSKKDLEKKKPGLQIEKALAEVSETAGALNTKFDLSSDMGAILSRVDDQIDTARARSRVASDLSDQSVDVLKAKLKADGVPGKRATGAVQDRTGTARALADTDAKDRGAKEAGDARVGLTTRELTWLRFSHLGIRKLA